MKKVQFSQIIFFFALFCSFVAKAQINDAFDIKAAYQQAKDKGIPQSDVEGYVRFLHDDYKTKKNKGGQHAHDHKNDNGVYDAGTIYLDGNSGSNPFAKPSIPNTPQNTYCPNAGFEQLNFANWTGAYGTVSTGATSAAFPTYNQTSATIVNSAGNNVGLTNTTNYHTIMTTPATNSVYPNFIGYDSIACRVVGTQTISEIPVVNPTGGPASVRLNGAVANYRASKLTYNMSLNPNNKNFSVSYAIVFNTYYTPHNAYEQPYFSVIVKDQNGNLVPGCSTYTVSIHPDMVNPSSPLYDPSWTMNAYSSTFSDQAFYRKWSTYAFDFSNYPTITSVTVEFYVGGCSQSGHYGYAYVDASCAPGGAVASFCAGSNTTILNAPGGYNSYQWTGPSGPVSVANGGNTPTATITPVMAGQVFTCNVTAANGCSSVFQTTVSITTVSVTGIGSTPSCQNGNSGTANVSATGSSTGYTYQWLNSSGTQVSTAQNATGLSPGVYTVNVSSAMCGAASATVAVGISPPTFYGLTAPFCGTTAWIVNSGGSNYKWYTASPLAVIAGATSSSLTINSPVNGAQYFLVYTTASGCKDSIRYTLAQQPGGSIYASNIKSICAGNNNSYAVINLQTNAPPVYNYTVTGPSGYNSILNNTTLLKDSVTGLSIGTYSATVFDGQCLYNTTFTVSPFVYSYTLTPNNTTICTPGSTSLTVNFGNTNPTACGLASSSCTSPNQVIVGTGANLNTNTTYPAPYGHYWKNNRHQILYTAAELLAAGVQPGKLSSMGFMVNSMNPPGTSSSNYIGTLQGVTIKMKCVSVNQISTFDNAGLQQVFYSASTVINLGWNTQVFQSAYEWDGVSNILVDWCYDITGSSYSSNPIMPSTSTGVVRCIYYYSDGTAACGNNSVSGSSTNRPNTRFGNCGGSNPAAFNYTWSPTASLNPTNTYTTIANPTVTTVYTVQVEPIGQTNCMQSQTSTVVVSSPSPATITPVNPMCTNASVLTLTVSPAGGNWVGSGISAAGVLTPSLATAGNNTYTYSLGTGTCSSMGTTTISIEQYVPSTIGGTINPICLPAAVVNLSTAVTTSSLGTGTWSGLGVTGSSFDPNISGTGTHTLTYSTNSIPTVSLCPSFSTIAVQVNSVSTPTINIAGPYCTNASTLMLAALPVGGTWSGLGITPGGLFDPSVAPVGINSYTYSIGSSTCSAMNTTTISVEQFVPSTITGSINTLCITNPAVDLSAALATSTLGMGTWSGNGVTGTIFDPAIAGDGTHTITYSTHSNPTATLCPSASTIAIVVNSVVQPTISAAGPFCDNYTTQLLSANPSGGIWTGSTGTSITAGGNFAPASSNLGNNTVYYTVTNAPCVKKDSIVVNVIHFVPATITGTVGPYCIYDASTNLQNIALNSVGTWSGPGVSGTIFTPSSAGANLHVLTYVTNPSPLLNCGSTETISVLVNPKPEASAVPNVLSGCNPVTIDYASTTVNTGTAIWNFGDGSANGSGLQTSHTYTTPGTYTATIYYTDANGCKDTTVATSGVTSFALPVASFEPSILETTVVDGQIDFTNHSTILTNNTYVWDIGGIYGSNQVNESHLFVNSGIYVITLTATSADGCVDDTSIIVKINPDVVLYVPNAFTPGADGLNDRFDVYLPPTGVDYSTYNIEIFNRWGELIYKSNDIMQSWNGAKNNSGPILKQDTYVYKISFKDEKKKTYEKVGHVLLMHK